MNKMTLPERILSARERREIVPYSDMHILRLERAGKFPRRLKLGGGGRVGWLWSEVQAWIEARAAERDSDGTTREASGARRRG